MYNVAQYKENNNGLSLEKNNLGGGKKSFCIISVLQSYLGISKHSRMYVSKSTEILFVACVSVVLREKVGGWVQLYKIIVTFNYNHIFRNKITVVTRI